MQLSTGSKMFVLVQFVLGRLVGDEEQGRYTSTVLGVYKFLDYKGESNLGPDTYRSVWNRPRRAANHDINS